MASDNNLSKFNYRLTLAFFVVQTIALIVFGYIIWESNQERAHPVLFTVYSPQKVLTNRAQLSQKTVRVQVTKCNLTNDDLTVGGTVYWVREAPFERILVVDIPLEKGTSYKPGCTERVYENAMPALVTLGTWHLEGNNIVEDSEGRQQRVAWHTESFEIVPDDVDTP